MNEKIISWFEDLLPEIKESGDVESTLLKFANDKNLAPALLEKIGHVYNTAKTVNYLDKAASTGRSRGESFVVLDVPAMLDKYTKSASSDKDYSNNEFSSRESDKLSDLFKTDSILSSLEEEEVERPEYHEVKLAAVKHEEFFNNEVKQANSQNSEQLIFDLTEDNQDICSDIADQLRVPDTEVSFESLEKDAMFYFEGGAKQACDYLHNYLASIGMHEKRATDAGKKRFVKNTDLLTKIATVQDNLNSIAITTDLKKKFIAKKAQTQPILDQYGNPVLPSPDALTSNPGDRNQSRSEQEDAGPTVINVASSPKEDSAEGKKDSPSRDKDKDSGKILKDLFHPTDGVVGKSYSGGKKVVEDYFTPSGEAGYNQDQEFMDYGEREQRREAMLMDLIITDPILSEEDPDEVINIYNTLKEMSPRLAEDKNVMRVALRSAVQHEGIAPQDIKQFLEVEQDMQKVRNNIDAENKRDYVIGNSEKAIKQKPQPRIVS